MKTGLSLIKDFFIGIIIGVANIIPGVSAGTMAIVCGVYEKLIGIFTLDKKFIKQNWLFILIIGAGAILGILAFSKLIKFLLAEYEMPTKFFFIGVVLGTCPLIFKRAFPGNSRTNFSPALITLALMIFLTIAEYAGGATPPVITQLDVGSFLRIFFVMALAAMAMIIPGISGSFVALALGVYPTVIAALSGLGQGNSLLILIPVALGVIVGLLGGAKLIKFLLGRFEKQTYSAIFGLLIGSVFYLAYPFLTSLGLNLELLISSLILIIGFFIAFAFGKAEAKK